ncbi:MAG: DNA polymerase/3'-5' exonuclease PolX [Chthoniobacterales bacterium]
MNKDLIIEVLENIGRLLELKGENGFKVRAYVNGARALESSSEDLAKVIDEGRLGEIDGIGKALEEKITTLFRDGQLDYYDELRSEFPPDIFTLFELRGVGPKKIKLLFDKLGISSVSALTRACADGRVADLEGFGEKTAANIATAIEERKRNAGVFTMRDVEGIARRLLDDFRGHPEVLLAEIAGSYRRGKETLHDLDLIVASAAPGVVSQDFVEHELVESVLAQGPTKSSVRLLSGIQCDLRVVSNAEYPFALNYFTGSKEHNVRMRSRALERGWSLNEYRFSEARGKARTEEIPDVRQESELYRALGLEYVPPELREDRGEFDAAEAGALPKLIEWHNLRGTFHNHTTASDGRASLEQMAEAAQELGLEYLGIADHSKSSVQANGLDAKRLAAQGKAIDKLNAADGGFRVFKGVECDVLKDGTLDLSDEVLDALDYVVASIHGSLQLDEAAMTKRIIKAISNPRVTMLGHLTGRLLTTRAPYAVNVPAVIEAAAEMGTIIELNCNPRRLDLDWRWWPLAKEKGVKCSINPDAHSTQGLQDLVFGVRIARKGWLTRDDVVNCLGLGKIEKVLRRSAK